MNLYKPIRSYKQEDFIEGGQLAGAAKLLAESVDILIYLESK